MSRRPPQGCLRQEWVEAGLCAIARGLLPNQNENQQADDDGEHHKDLLAR